MLPASTPALGNTTSNSTHALSSRDGPYGSPKSFEEPLVEPGQFVFSLSFKGAILNNFMHKVLDASETTLSCS
jgi:hypothetical protein